MRRTPLALLLAPVVVYAAPPDLPKDKPAGHLEVVHTFDKDMPTGVTVSKGGRIFLTFPRWGDPVEMNVVELRDGKVVPYPNAEINQLHIERPAECLCTVQSAIVDPLDRLWLCDTGTVNMGPVLPGGAKMICIDLATDKVVKQFPLGEPGVLKTTYLNDLRFDMRKGSEGVAYITDSSATGPNGIVVVDLATGRTWRRLSDHPSTRAEKNFQPVVEGRVVMEKPKPDAPARHLGIGSDGIALGHDGQKLYYCSLASRHLYSVSAEALADPEATDRQVADTVEDLGDRGFASDGLEFDADGRLYLTDYEHNAVLRRSADGKFETLAHDPRLLWPDTLSVGHDGYLYLTANQLHRQPRFQAGKDEREKPFVLFKVKADAKPVVLKR
jgi:sugar lactone lactonase YvrE